ncbi:MAG: hypothetical protein QGG64_27060, partial [Candidatus Latescibacteria bacterium]|nr:hypothetical protein [Candidatus Latescibacterota bacterium]
MILAIDIGGTQFGLALSTTKGHVIKHIQCPTDRADNAQTRIDQILAQSKALITQSPAPISACGIG